MIEHPHHAKEAFSAEILERIAHVIADVEAATNAEIRISVRDLREASEADLSIAEVAKKEFVTLGMHHTEGRVGVLLLVLYHERKFYVLGDEGVHSRVNPETWDDVSLALKDHFKKADYEGGLRAALLRIQHHLKGVLPRKKKSVNELSNEVVVR